MELRSRVRRGPSPWVVGLLLVAVIVAAAAVVLVFERGVRAITNPPKPPPSKLALGGPTIQIAPQEGGPGTVITIRGQGWQADDSLFIRVEDPVNSASTGLAAYALTTVPESSEFDAQFTFPSDPVINDTSYVTLTVWSPLTGAEASQAFRLIGAPQPQPPATPGVGQDTPAPATIAPTTTARPQRMGQVLTSPGDLRAGPGLAWATLASVPSGTAFSVLAQNGAGDWLYVIIGPGLTGWLARASTDYTGQAQTIADPPLPATATASPTSTATLTPIIMGWRGEYYSTQDLTGSPAFVRGDANIDFAWGDTAPGPDLRASSFSVRWTRTSTFDEGLYRFHAIVNGGARVWADRTLVIDAWQDGPQREVTGDAWLPAGNHDLRVEYANRSGGAYMTAWWELVPAPVYPNWKGEYWSNPGLSGSRSLVRNDGSIDFNWGTTSPNPNLPPERFSARWTRWFTFDPAVYRFTARADDGVRVYVDGLRVIDQWHAGQGTVAYTADLALTGAHWVAVEYYQDGGNALIRFNWAPVAPWPVTPTFTPVPPTATHTAVPPTATPPIIIIPPPPSSTPVPPTATFPPPPTFTPVPPPTNTPVPPTLPPPTDTPAPPPPPTNTPAPPPPPTNTPAPPPATATPIPVATSTPRRAAKTATPGA